MGVERRSEEEREGRGRKEFVLFTSVHDWPGPSDSSESGAAWCCSEAGKGLQEAPGHSPV